MEKEVGTEEVFIFEGRIIPPRQETPMNGRMFYGERDITGLPWHIVQAIIVEEDAKDRYQRSLLGRLQTLFSKWK